METTQLLYLLSSTQLVAEAKVVKIGRDEQGRDFIILDQTIFYPQGGGQPADQGKIKGLETTFIVSDVRLINDCVYHYGHWEGNSLQVDAVVTLAVDKDRRRLNSRNHSAGHLLDYVLHEIDEDLKPIKGFHFPEGPYIEYQGLIENPDLLVRELETRVNSYIKKGGIVLTEILTTKDELQTKCYFVPDYIPENKPIRIVLIYGGKGVPCGGTHVQNITEIGSLKVTKIKTKDGNTRISYQLAE